MAPVVDGLKQTYSGQVEFRSLNAAEEGTAAFQAYGLSGHPGYVILDPSGEVLWRGFGQLSADRIAETIDSLIVTK